MPHTTISNACRVVRGLTGQARQYFGAEMNISAASLQHYEAGNRVPEPRNLVTYAAVARTLGREDLYQLFLDEFCERVAPPPSLDCKFVAFVNVLGAK